MRIIVIFIFLMALGPVSAQEPGYASWTNEKLILDNGEVTRIINLDPRQQGISTGVLKLSGDDYNFLEAGIPGNELKDSRLPSREFSLRVNDQDLSGNNGWKLSECTVAKDNGEGRGAVITLKHLDQPLKVEVVYMLYPGLPIIRKKLKISNTGSEELKLEAIDIEHLRITDDTRGWHEHNTVVYRDYARYKHLGAYLGTHHDPAVIAHFVPTKSGMVLGNEAPGIMKRIGVFLDRQTFSIGLTHPDQDNAFRKWVEPGKSWESPWVFTCLYKDTDNPHEAVNGPVADFVRKHMGIRLSEIKEKPVFLYNTWNPFRDQIDEKLIYELAEAAAQCGIEEFIIDVGWFKNRFSGTTRPWSEETGDYLIDPERFPNGLKPVFDHIKGLGMKPGLWISNANIGITSEINRSHPEWLIIGPEGKPVNLHTLSDKYLTACLTTDWYYKIKEHILRLVHEHGLEYVKMDLAVVTSAYRNEKEYTGCYALNHPHRDRQESFLMIYDRVWQLYDELHEEAPELFIDCTFETVGELQMIDFAMCKHAEGNWLSNFEERAPSGALRVRQMAWWRSPLIPATALVIGNQMLDDPGVELTFMSLAGALPIMLGDPRALPGETKQMLKSLSGWTRRMQDKHDYMMFRQDLPGYGEPTEGQWDGFQRINTDSKSGGIVGIFRHGSLENTRHVFIQGLDPDRIYEVRKAVSELPVVQMSGKELAEMGFSVTLTDLYDGVLFEVDRAGE